MNFNTLNSMRRYIVPFIALLIIGTLFTNQSIAASWQDKLKDGVNKAKRLTEDAAKKTRKTIDKGSRETGKIIGQGVNAYHEARKPEWQRFLEKNMGPIAIGGGVFFVLIIIIVASKKRKE